MYLDQHSRAFMESLPANRKIGKFFLTAHRGWHKSTFAMRKSLEHIRTGQNMGWYAPTMIPIRNAWDDLWARALGKENMDKWLNRQSNVLSPPGMGSVYFYSLVDPNTAAGPTFPFIIGDEWGAIQDLRYEAVIEPILLKGLITYGRAEAWFVGTPNREGNPKNDFWKSLNTAANMSGKDRNAYSYIIPLPGKVVGEELIPYESPFAHPGYTYELARTGYDNAQRKVAWRIEWLCEFLNDEGGQFEKDAIESQCSLPFQHWDLPIPPPIGFEGEWSDRVFHCKILPGHIPGQVDAWYQTGIDIGLSHDRVAIGVLDRNTMKQVFQLHFLPEGKQRWHCVYEAIALVMQRFPGTCYVDITGTGGKDASSVLEHMHTYYGLRPDGVVFDRINKPILLDWASSLLEGEKVWLFDDAPLKFELEMMQRKVRATGGYDIAAPQGDGMHDDLPIMFALMCKDVRPIQSSSGVAYAANIPPQVILDPIMNMRW